VGNAALFRLPWFLTSRCSRKFLYLVTGALLSSLLALVTAIVIEARDKSIRTVDEAKKLFDLPQSDSFLKRLKIPWRWRFRAAPELLLEFPRSRSAPLPDAASKPEVLSSDKELKVVVVTSSVPKEVSQRCLPI